VDAFDTLEADSFDTDDDFDLEEGFDDSWDDEDFFADDLDELDEFNWREWASPVVSVGQTIYGSPLTKSWRGRNKGADAAIRGVFGALKGIAGSSWLKDGMDTDPFEPEYESDAIDAMEATAEDAIDGDGIDSMLAADELISRSFGPMRTSPQLRPVLALLHREMRRLIAGARRNPRLRTFARVAPLALRRTAVVLTRMAMGRRRVSPQLALQIFRRTLQTVVRSQQLRARALQRARLRTRRYQSRRPSTGRSVMVHRGSYPSRRRHSLRRSYL